ncbi:MAG: o-succinylbenzoate--CoA ligase, partial [Prochlorococcaceae cyanobacterium]
TETAAMVCALPPDRFLAGDGGCGQPLADVALRLEEPHAAIAVRSGRLSPGWLENGVLQPLPQREGWWVSGDAGALAPAGLSVLGRLDGAIHSGGETVFPELLEARLLGAAAAAGLPIEAVLLLAEPHPVWGERLVALVRGSQPEGGVVDSPERLLAALAALTAHWLPAERPSRWLLCAELAPTPEGKFQRGEWQRWLLGQAGSPSGGVRAAERPSPGLKPPASG